MNLDPLENACGRTPAYWVNGCKLKLKGEGLGDVNGMNRGEFGIEWERLG